MPALYRQNPEGSIRSRKTHKAALVQTTRQKFRFRDGQEIPKKYKFFHLDGL
jgi:hypothetical protein